MNEFIASEIIKSYRPENIKAKIILMNKTLNYALMSGEYKVAIEVSDGLTDAIKKLEIISRLTKGQG